MTRSFYALLFVLWLLLLYAVVSGPLTAGAWWRVQESNLLSPGYEPGEETVSPPRHTREASLQCSPVDETGCWHLNGWLNSQRPLTPAFAPRLSDRQSYPRGMTASLALTWAEASSVICFDGAAWDCDTALLIAFRESRFVPDAYNPGCRCVGLFQLAPVHHARFLARDWEWSDAYDAVRNTAIAYELWLDQGWHPWRY